MNPELFETLFVTNIYSKISNHFNKTRYHTWPKIKDFVNSLKTNSIIYDIGCGNGRNMNIRSDCTFIGYDNNQSLLSQIKNPNLSCFYGDNLSLPINDNTADVVLSIAVIHHFSTYERRLQALSELFRILRPYGLALIYVWAHEQEKFANHKKNTLVHWNDQTTGKLFHRYYYLFSNKELDNLVTNHFPNVNIIESDIQCHNYYIICQKLSN